MLKVNSDLGIGGYENVINLVCGEPQLLQSEAAPVDEQGVRSGRGPGRGRGS